MIGSITVDGMIERLETLAVISGCNSVSALYFGTALGMTLRQLQGNFRMLCIKCVKTIAVIPMTCE